MPWKLGSQTGNLRLERSDRAGVRAGHCADVKSSQRFTLAFSCAPGPSSLCSSFHTSVRLQSSEALCKGIRGQMRRHKASWTWSRAKFHGSHAPCERARTWTLMLSPQNQTGKENQPGLDTAGVLRKLLGVVGLAGVVETSFLSVKELLDPVASFCPTEGCRTVLNSAYSDISGIPLALFGLSSFLVFSFVALYPYLLPADKEDSALRDLETRQAMLVLSSGMTAISVYNIGIMAFELNAFCQYCVVSALLTFVLCIGSVVLTKQDKDASLMPGAYSFLSASVLALFLFITAELDSANDEYEAFTTGLGMGTSAASAQAEGFEPPAISTTSSEYAMKLAQQLEAQNATMFGAYWCSHCYDQKQTFGKEAYRMIRYVECDKKGFKSQNKLCQEKKIPGYPTWEINGELYPGELELQDLDDISSMERDVSRFEQR